MTTRYIRAGAVLAFSLTATLASGGAAVADNVVFTVVADNAVTVDGDTVSVAPDTAVTAKYKITSSGNDGGPTGESTQRFCNAADGSPATVTIHAPAGVTAEPATLTFTSCDAFQAVTFRAAAAGSYEITESVADSGAGGYKNQAHFTLIVNGAEVATVADTTPPVVTLTADRAADANGWYNRPVTVTATADELADCAPAATYSGPDNASATVSLSCTDLAGNTGTGRLGLGYDGTAPTLRPSVSPNPVPLNGAATATPDAADATSGVASASCATVDTATVGSHSVTCTGTDIAGNSAIDSAPYTVVYRTNGVLQPVNADGSSVFQLGRTVPVKFQALDVNGVPVGTSGLVSAFRLVASGTGAMTGVNEGTTSTTPDTAFRYDPTAGQWIYNLSTKNLRAGTTYRYEIKLDDGVTIIPFTFAAR